MKALNKPTIRNISGYYLVLAGCCVLVFWSLFVINDTGFKQQQPVDMYFHIGSEVIMSILCLFAGWYQVKRNEKSLAIAAHAMLVYSTLNAAGFYAGKNEFVPMILFLLLTAVSLSVLGPILFSAPNRSVH